MRRSCSLQLNARIDNPEDTNRVPCLGDSPGTFPCSASGAKVPRESAHRSIDVRPICSNSQIESPMHAEAYLESALKSQDRTSKATTIYTERGVAIFTTHKNRLHKNGLQSTVYGQLLLQFAAAVIQNLHNPYFSLIVGAAGCSSIGNAWHGE